MALSKKHLSMAALALLCAAVFPSCKGDGKKDQPTPPPAEEKSLIASLTVKATYDDRNFPTREYFYTYQYSYDKSGRVTSVALRGDDNEDWSFTYGDGMMTITVDSERIEFLTDANGYIVRDKTGDYSATHDAEGHLLQLLWEDDSYTHNESYTLKWKGDLLSEALCSIANGHSITTTLVYSKTMKPAGLGIIYGCLGGDLSDGDIFPLRMWLGKEPAYLPSKVITHYAKDGKQYSEEIITFDTTPDAKGRPEKIFVTETSYEYDQYKGKNPLPDSKAVSTIEITYK